MDEERLKIAKAEFAKMEEAGITECSNSLWSSPLHMVPIPDSSWCPCGDYRQLNTKTVPDHYPLTHINDMTAQLHGYKVFNKLDLTKAYYQVKLTEDTIPKTAVIMSFVAMSSCPSLLGCEML